MFRQRQSVEQWVLWLIAVVLLAKSHLLPLISLSEGLNGAVQCYHDIQNLKISLKCAFRTKLTLDLALKVEFG